MRRSLLAAAFVLACAASPSGRPADPGAASQATGVASPEADAGALVYARYCSACHGVDAKGRTELAMAFKKPPPDLTRIAARRGGWFPDVFVREIVDGRLLPHGDRIMPVWGHVLTERELSLVTEHLRSLQVQEDGTTAP
jgi:mono/diheme cytochrome c family protein